MTLNDIDWISWGEWALVTGVPLVISIASVIAAATPTPRDDAVLGVVRKVVDILAANVAHAQTVNGRKLAIAQNTTIPADIRDKAISVLKADPDDAVEVMRAVLPAPKVAGTP